MDHTGTIDTLVGDYLDIEKEISGQKGEQRAIRSAIRALDGLDTLKDGIKEYKDAIWREQDKLAKAKAKASK